MLHRTVDRAVQASPVWSTAPGFDGDLVLLLEVGQFDAVVLEGHGRVQGLAVEVDGCHFVGNQSRKVDEPGFALKQMSDLEPKFFAPTVRSRST